jgi:hypothetical protein
MALSRSDSKAAAAWSPTCSYVATTGRMTTEDRCRRRHPIDQRLGKRQEEWTEACRKAVVASSLQCMGGWKWTNRGPGGDWPPGPRPVADVNAEFTSTQSSHHSGIQIGPSQKPQAPRPWSQ